MSHWHKCYLLHNWCIREAKHNAFSIRMDYRIWYFCRVLLDQLEFQAQLGHQGIQESWEDLDQLDSLDYLAAMESLEVKVRGESKDQP